MQYFLEGTGDKSPEISVIMADLRADIPNQNLTSKAEMITTLSAPCKVM
jgi:hypothetical protein